MQENGSPHSLSIIQTANKLKWYPFVAICCYLLPTIARISEIVGYESDIVDEISSFTSYIQGFLDSIVYLTLSPAISVWGSMCFDNSRRRNRHMSAVPRRADKTSTLDDLESSSHSLLSNDIFICTNVAGDNNIRLMSDTSSTFGPNLGESTPIWNED